MVTVTELNRAPDGRFESLEATDTLTDPNGTDHTGEIADSSDVSTIQSSSDVTVTDTATGTVSSGEFLKNVSGSLTGASVSASGNLSDALSNGQVLADDGNLYNSIQTAENNATDYLFIGSGTFNESVTIDTSGLTMVGSNDGTLINGGTNGEAVIVNAANITLRDFNAQTEGDSFTRDVIETDTNADNINIENVTIVKSDRNAMEFQHGSGHMIYNCVIESTTSDGIRIDGTDGVEIKNSKFLSSISTSATSASNATDIVVSNNFFEKIGDQTVDMNCDDSVIANNLCNDSIYVTGNDVIILGNRVMNGFVDGINVSGTDDIIVANRISDSSDSDLVTSSATSPKVVGNLTGASN